MATNEYGLDHSYLENRMNRMIRDIDRFTPDEAFNELSRMAMVAANQAGMKVEIKVKFNKGKD